MKPETKPTDAATPRPWKFSEEKEPHVRSSTGLSTVAIMNTSATKEAKANAALIVRAVNLLAAHEAVAEAAQTLVVARYDGDIENAKHIAKNALAALSKLKEEQK